MLTNRWIKEGPMRMRINCSKWPELRRATWLAMAAGAIAVSAVGCTREEPPAAEVIRPVRTHVLSTEGYMRIAALPGVARASTVVDLAFQVPGLLVKFPVEEGQRFAKGDVIGELRTEEFEARLATLTAQLEQSRVLLRTLEAGQRPEERLRLEADLRAAEARLASAQAQFDRFSSLRNTGAVSKADLDRVEADFRVAQEDRQTAVQLLEIGTTARPEYIEAQKAEIRALEGRLREAALQVQDAVLKAPFDGVVARRFVDANQSINIRQPIVTFQSFDELSVDVDVPESLMATDLRTADIEGTTAEFAAMPGRLFPVSLGEIAQVADPVTQTFRARFSLKMPPGVSLLPGMSATVRLRYKLEGSTGTALSVPVSAIYTDPTGAQVAWIIDQDLIARRTPVKVGAVSEGSIEIIEGLKAGDRIATAGVSLLRDGLKVRDLGDALGRNGR